MKKPAPALIALGILIAILIVLVSMLTGYLIAHPPINEPIDQPTLADANAQQLYPGLIRVIDRGAGVVIYIYDRGTSRAALAVIPIAFTRIEYQTTPEAKP